MTFGIFPNVNSISLVRVGNSVISPRLHRQVEGQPGKKAKKDGDKSAVALLKNVRLFGCVFQDTESPESSAFFTEGQTSTIQKNCAASCKHPRNQRSVARKKSSQRSSSAQFLRFEIGG